MSIYHLTRPVSSDESEYLERRDELDEAIRVAGERTESGHNAVDVRDGHFHRVARVWLDGGIDYISHPVAS